MNEEDLNPAQPNIRDDALNGMNVFVKLFFIGFALGMICVIAWMIFSLTQKPKVVEEYTSYYPSHGNIVIYPDDAVNNVVVMNNRFHSVTNGDVEFKLFDYPTRWFSLTCPDTNWHWTNVVFSSTREPVVTKTNGEWRIQFK